MKRIILLSCCLFLALLLFSCNIGGSGDDSTDNESVSDNTFFNFITPNNGAVNFYQIVFAFSGLPDNLTNSDEGAYSGTGMFEISNEILNRDGFVQVVTDQGWVVQNFPVSSLTEYDKFTVKFRLDNNSVTPPINSLNAVVYVTDEPVVVSTNIDLTDFADKTLSWDVKPYIFNAEGKGESATSVPAPPVVENLFSKTLSSSLSADKNYDDVFNVKALKALETNNWVVSKNFNICTQKNHSDRNIQAADDQCGPASITNSLKWVEDIWGESLNIKLPHNYGMGLKGDNTMVGQLDNTTGRGVKSRVNGDPLFDPSMLNGKLKYLADNKICLDVKHQDDIFGSDNKSYNGFQSTGHGKPTFEFICKEICKGEDVELGYSWYVEKGGKKIWAGHWVNAIGCGQINGKPFVTYVSDHDQKDDTKGTGKIDFTFLKDTDGDKLPNMINEGKTHEIDIVMSESPPAKEQLKDEDVCPWLKEKPVPDNDTTPDNGTAPDNGTSPDTGTTPDNDTITDLSNISEQCTGVTHYTGYSEINICIEGTIPAGAQIVSDVFAGGSDSVITETEMSNVCLSNIIEMYGLYAWTVDVTYENLSTTLSGSINVGPDEIACP